jgi:hypothetical protein
MAVDAQPAQLPGQGSAGKLPGASAKPAVAAPPSAGAALPISPCCGIAAINKTTGVVTAREENGNRTIEIKATPAQVQNLRVGEDISANFDTKKASLDGKIMCCDLVLGGAAPSLGNSASAAHAPISATRVLRQQDPTSAIVYTYVRCPTFVTAPTPPAGWSGVPSIPMQFPFSTMLLIGMDGSAASLDTMHVSATLKETKYINCYYKGNSYSGNVLTDYPNPVDQKPRLWMTLAAGGNPDRYWNCEIMYGGSEPNLAKCRQN